jgi:hypothetical protein
VGVASRLIRKVDTTEELFDQTEETMLRDGTVGVNDLIVIIPARPCGWRARPTS